MTNATPDWVLPFEAGLDELDKLDDAHHRAFDPHHIVHKDCPDQTKGLKSKKDEISPV